MARNDLIKGDIELAHQGDEEAITRLVEHYAYLMDRIMEELSVSERDWEDVNGAMLLGMLIAIKAYKTGGNFSAYVERNMRREAEKCLKEISLIAPQRKKKQHETYDMEDAVEDICASILAHEMLTYLHVSYRVVVMARFGITTDGDVKGFKAVQQLCQDRPGANSVKNLSRITNESLETLRELFGDKATEL